MKHKCLNEWWYIDSCMLTAQCPWRGWWRPVQVACQLKHQWSYCDSDWNTNTGSDTEDIYDCKSYQLLLVEAVQVLSNTQQPGTHTHTENNYNYIYCCMWTDWYSLQDLDFVQMCEEWKQQLVSELTVTQVQFCQPFRDVQQMSQSSTGPLIQCGVTEVQFSTQGSTQGLRPPHCVSVSVHRNQGHQLEDDSLTGSEQENQNKEQTGQDDLRRFYTETRA